MKLRTYTDIKLKKLPNPETDFNLAMQMATEVLEAFSEENIIWYTFYGSAARGDATISSDLDILVILDELEPIRLGILLAMVSMIQDTLFVPVNLSVESLVTMRQGIHRLNPLYVGHVIKYSSQPFPEYIETMTARQEVQRYASSRLGSLSEFFTDPKYICSAPYCENEHFLSAVGKAHDTFSHIARKLICLENFSDDSMLNVYNLYQQIATGRAIEFYDFSRSFRLKYDNLVLVEPSEDQYERFLKEFGISVVRAAQQFIFANADSINVDEE